MRSRGTTAKLIYSFFIMLALYLSVLIASSRYTTVFIAFLIPGWHILANIDCSFISSYRFKNPSAKYIEIKNKVIKNIFVHSFTYEGVDSANNSDQRINMIGLILHIINIILFVFFEILLFLPKIPCKPYVFTLTFGTRPRNYDHLYLELDSWNEIISAEGARAFAFVLLLVFLIFYVMFGRQVKARRRELERKTKYTPPKKGFVKQEWHFPLYNALIDIAVRKNNKKHKFWYHAAQLEEIEALVADASEYAELKTERKGNKLLSFTVFDTLNDHTMFKGFFI